jgi:hypothetical protein
MGRQESYRDVPTVIDSRSASTNLVIPDAAARTLLENALDALRLSKRPRVGFDKGALRDEDKNHEGRRTSVLAIGSLALRAAFCFAASHDRNHGMRFGSKANERRN